MNFIMGEEQGMGSPEPMVENPLHVNLIRLRARLVEEAETLRGALGKAESDMGGGQVWVGPSADRWKDELGGRRAQLKRAVERLLGDVDEALARHPAMVPAHQAELIRRRLSGRMG
ncbi:hypothetical protein [Rhizohabitans arisaemae]|uniref:hypothetical protein n=1 Tax=Rhizohabitans arisaemae TaxID=2720610 RepID=UPI0024B28403|nr:hypothetical protein [Rhizohabitans arisaemae]